MFGFPKVPYKRFENSFLASVSCKISFNEIEVTTKLTSMLKDSFKADYPRVKEFTGKTGSFNLVLSNNNQNIELTDDASNQHTLFEFRSEDGQVILLFSKDSVTLNISGKSYKDRETFFLELNKALTVLNSIGISESTGMMLRKLNVVQFNREQNDISSSLPSFIENIFQPDLVGNLSYFPTLEFIERSMHAAKFIKGDDSLSVEFGFILNKKDINQQNGQLITDIELLSNKEFNLESIKDVYELLSDEIYRVFHWVYTKEAKEIMR